MDSGTFQSTFGRKKAISRRFIVTTIFADDNFIKIYMLQLKKRFFIKTIAKGLLLMDVSAIGGINFLSDKIPTESSGSLNGITPKVDPSGPDFFKELKTELNKLDGNASNLMMSMIKGGVSPLQYQEVNNRRWECFAAINRLGLDIKQSINQLSQSSQ